MCVHMRSVCRHDDAVIVIAHQEEDDLFRVFGADENDIGTWTTTTATTTNRWYIAAAAASAAVPSAILPSCGVYNKRGMRMSDVCACALCMRMSRSGILCICCGLNARWPVSRRTVFLKGARVERGWVLWSARALALVWHQSRWIMLVNDNRVQGNRHTIIRHKLYMHVMCGIIFSLIAYLMRVLIFCTTSRLLCLMKRKEKKWSDHWS